MRRLIQSIPFGGQIQAVLGELHAHLATQPDVERGFNVVVYLSPTFEVGARVEIGVEVGQRFEASSEVRRLELLQGSVARTVHRGRITNSAWPTRRYAIGPSAPTRRCPGHTGRSTATGQTTSRGSRQTSSIYCTMGSDERGREALPRDVGDA